MSNTQALLEVLTHIQAAGRKLAVPCLEAVGVTDLASRDRVAYGLASVAPVTQLPEFDVPIVGQRPDRRSIRPVHCDPGAWGDRCRS